MSIQESTTEVEYLSISGWPGYCVGSDGTVWSRWTQKGAKHSEGIWYIISDNWKILRPKLVSGYPSVSLKINGEVEYCYVHRLVLEAFVGPCPEGMECRHLDDDKLNNNLSNLQWGTRLENMADAVRNAKMSKGEGHWLAKLTEKNICEIKRLYSEGSHDQNDLAKMFDVNQTGISKIVRDEDMERCWWRLCAKKPKRKITQDIIDQVLKLFDSGMKKRVISRHIGFDCSVICRIIAKHHCEK